MNVDLTTTLKKLQELDLSDIDFSQFGEWPAAIKITTCTLILLLSSFLGYNFHLSNLQTELKRLESQEENLKQQFGKKAFQAAHLEAYKKQMTELEASFKELLHQLPRDTEVPALLEDITRTGLGSGLEFEEIRLMPEIVRQFYTEQPISITVVGDYHDLATFAASVTSLPRIVTLHDFNLKPAAPNSESRLRLNIAARTYRYNDQEVKQ